MLWSAIACYLTISLCYIAAVVLLAILVYFKKDGVKRAVLTAAFGCRVLSDLTIGCPRCPNSQQPFRSMWPRAVVGPGRLLARCSRPSIPTRHLRPLCSPVATDKKEEKPPAKPPSPLDARAALLPGIAAAAGVAALGFTGAEYLGQGLLAAQGISGASPISGIPVSIILGIGLSNTMTLPENLKPGLKWCSTTALRAGIVCVGAKLSCFDMVQLGAVG